MIENCQPKWKENMLSIQFFSPQMSRLSAGPESSLTVQIILQAGKKACWKSISLELFSRNFHGSGTFEGWNGKEQRNPQSSLTVPSWRSFFSFLVAFFALPLSVFPFNAPFYLRSNPGLQTSTILPNGDVTKILSFPYLTISTVG